MTGRPFTGMLRDDTNVYFGVNPVRPDLGSGSRGTTEDVVRLAALFADLDVKDDGFASLDQAMGCVRALSAMLGSPRLLIFSGHGLQPVWTTDPADDRFLIAHGEDRSRLQVLLRRFGRLVAGVAAEQGASVDQVFELARMLRMPGTRNVKDPTAPVEVTAQFRDQEPLGYDQLTELLEARGVEAFDEDAEVLPAEQSDPSSWPWSTSTCPYLAGMVAGWATDRPTGSRHNWVVAQATRLAAAHRLGCVRQVDHQHALDVLEKRFMSLLRARTSIGRKLRVRRCCALGRPTRHHEVRRAVKCRTG